MIKIKKISVLVIMATLLMSSLSVNAANFDETASYIQLKETEVTDIDELIVLACQGVDDFSEETGLTFNMNGEIIEEKLDSPYAINRYSLNDGVDDNVEVYKTSQYLGTVIGDEGDAEKIYALNGIVLYSDPSESDSKTNGGCTIVTTLHCAWNSSGMKLKLIDSQAYLTGTLQPSSLLMENNAYEGWITNKQHYNSREVLLPSNGYYTLSSSYMGYISDMGSYLIAEDTLSFGSGGTLKTHVDISPEGY